jgi:signal peptidase I
MGGDTFYNERGEMRVKFAGETRTAGERDYNAVRGWNHKISRLTAADEYPALEAAARASAWIDLGLNPPASLQRDAATAAGIRYPDYISYEKSWLELLCAAAPQDSRYSVRLARHQNGWYVADDRIFPLGDNRDNSRDGRYFGPVRKSRVLGQGSFKYWPVGRVGVIK